MRLCSQTVRRGLKRRIYRLYHCRVTLNRNVHQIVFADPGSPTPSGYVDEAMRSVRKAFPRCHYTVWSLHDAVAFITEHFPPDVLRAFHCLRPYSYKADLFKFCVLHVIGGWYVDAGVRMLKSPLSASFAHVPTPPEIRALQQQGRLVSALGLLRRLAVRRTRPPSVHDCDCGSSRQLPGTPLRHQSDLSYDDTLRQGARNSRRQREHQARVHGRRQGLQLWPRLRAPALWARGDEEAKRQRWRRRKRRIGRLEQLRRDVEATKGLWNLVVRPHRGIVHPSESTPTFTCFGPDVWIISPSCSCGSTPPVSTCARVATSCPGPS